MAVEFCPSQVERKITRSNRRVFLEEYTDFAKKTQHFLFGFALVLPIQHTHAIVISKRFTLSKKTLQATLH